MPAFFEALSDPDAVFLRNALILGLIGCVPLGAVGTFVVARRISYLAAAIAHSVLGGVGVAVFCREGLGIGWAHPMLGAVLAALLAAGLTGWVSIRAKQREESVIGAIWVSGMAIGLIFIAMSPGYFDLNAYLFGDILLVAPSDLWISGLLALLVVVTLVLWHRPIVAVCFDPEFAAIRGIRADRIYLLLLCLTALTVVLLVSLVGIVLVIALLTLPPAIASVVSRKLWQMLVTASVLNGLLVVSGLGVSYSMDLPAGPVIILLAGFLYIAVSARARGQSARAPARREN